MSAVMADTHAVLWYLLGSSELSPAARRAMEDALRGGDPIYMASVSMVEIVYLANKHHTPAGLLARIISALREEEPSLVLAPLDVEVTQALPRVPRDQAPDMADRLIVATALVRGLPLVTRNRRIRMDGLQTIW